MSRGNRTDLPVPTKADHTERGPLSECLGTFGALPATSDQPFTIQAIRAASPVNLHADEFFGMPFSLRRDRTSEPIDQAGPNAFALATSSLPGLLTVCGNHPIAQSFRTRMQQFPDLLKRCGTDESRWKEASDLLRSEVEAFAGFQQKEVDLLCSAIDSSLNRMSETLRIHAEGNGEISIELDAIDQGLRHAARMDRIDEVRKTLTTQMKRIRSLSERQALIEDQVRAAYASTIRELEDRLQQAEEATSIDHLTKLANRKAFDFYLQGIFEKAMHGSVHSLVLIDLDNLKAVNDQMGHASGDALLRAFALQLRTRVPSEGLVARIGGDEFAAILAEPLATTLERFRGMQRFHDRTPLPFQHTRKDCHVKGGFSFGAAELRTCASVSEALELADRQMYANKSERKQKRQSA